MDKFIPSQYKENLTSFTNLVQIDIEKEKFMSEVKVNWAVDRAYRDVCITAAGFRLTYNEKHSSSDITVSKNNCYSSIRDHAIGVDVKDLDTLIEAMVKMKELIQQGEK